MGRRTNRSEGEQEQKRRRQAKSMPGGKAETQTSRALLAALSSGSIRAAALQAQAAWLDNAWLQGAQRQKLAAHIGQVQGNQHLQRAMESQGRGKPGQLALLPVPRARSLEPRSGYPWIQRGNDGVEVPVEIDHGVPVIYQESLATCWAAAVAMLVHTEYGPSVPTALAAYGPPGIEPVITPRGVAETAGLAPLYDHDVAVSEGHLQRLASAWELTAERADLLTPKRLYVLLQVAPVVVGYTRPRGHFVLVRGLRGNLASEQDLTVIINDPDAGVGEETFESFRRRRLAAMLHV